MRKLLFAAALAAAMLMNPMTTLAGGDDRTAAALAGLDALRGLQGADGCIGSESASAWAAIAFARAGERPASVALPGRATLEDCVVAHTRPVGGTTLTTDEERQVLAMAAAGADPRTAAGYDAVADILAQFSGGQLGDPTLLNDDIFGLMALHAAGVADGDPIVQAVRGFVAQNQLPTGAWSYATWLPPNDNTAFGVLFADVDTTGAAIVALTATGTPGDDTAILRGLAWMRGNQELLTGGCTWSPAGVPLQALDDPASLLDGTGNSDSTSWATMGVVASGGDPEGPVWSTATGASLISFILSMQQPDGSFAWMHGDAGFSPVTTTANAVVALLGHTWVA